MFSVVYLFYFFINFYLFSFRYNCLHFLLDFTYLLFRERGREGEKEGEKQQCVRDTLISCLSHAPKWGPGAQPRHMLAAFQFTGWRSIH